MPNVIRSRSDEAPGAALVAALVEELLSLYPTLDSTVAPSATPAELDVLAGGAFLILEDDAGVPVGCGGIKRLDARCAEIKRMYVVPAARGQGLSHIVLAALEAEARALGYERVRLDTGIHQPVAKALYETAGYESIPDYNLNPYASFWFEKVL